MKVMGQEISQKQKQTFYLKWTAEDKKDGNYVVTQEIIGLKMNINIGGNTISYDSTEEKQPQNPMSDFFKALLGMKLKLTISPKMKVINVEGQEEFIKKLGGTNPQMEPLLKKHPQQGCPPADGRAHLGRLAHPGRGRGQELEQLQHSQPRSDRHLHDHVHLHLRRAG